MSAKGQGDPGEDRTSRVGAESPCSDMKRAAAKKLIVRYFYQLTDGCGNPQCDNQNCASSGKITNLTPNEAAAQAIQLFSQEARLCDGTQPSKVARTTLEPGPASLGKSLSVKSANPTCSDEDVNPTKVAQESTSDCKIQEIDILAIQQKECTDLTTSFSSYSNNTNEESCYLSMLDRYNISIPHCGQTRHKNRRRRRKRRKIMSYSLERRRRKALKKKDIKQRYTRESVMKLFILANYLKHLERKRYFV